MRISVSFPISVFTLAIDLIVGVAPPERAGAASAIAETAAEFGGAIGIAIFGSIGVAIYRSGVAESIHSGIPAGVAEAARDTLGGAVAAASQLPDAIGSALIDGARQAFINGLHISALISALGALGLAIFIAVLLRGVRGGREPEVRQEMQDESATSDIVVDVVPDAVNAE